MQEGKDLNYISFSPVNDVRPPVNTSDSDRGEQLRVPPGPCSATGGGLLTSALPGSASNTGVAVLQLENLHESEGGGLFTTASHCNFAGGFSVGERRLCPVFEHVQYERLMLALGVFMMYDSFELIDEDASQVVSEGFSSKENPKN